MANDPVCGFSSESLLLTGFNGSHTRAYNYCAAYSSPCGDTVAGKDIALDGSGLLAWDISSFSGGSSVPASPLGSLAAYRLGSFGGNVLVSAADIFAMGAPDRQFRWDLNSGSTVDIVSSAPWIAIHIGGGPFGRGQVHETVTIAFANGAVTTRSICLRRTSIGRLTC